MCSCVSEQSVSVAATCTNGAARIAGQSIIRVSSVTNSEVPSLLAAQPSLTSKKVTGVVSENRGCY